MDLSDINFLKVNQIRFKDVLIESILFFGKENAKIMTLWAILIPKSLQINVHTAQICY